MARQNISGNFKAELTLLNLLNTIHDVSQFIKKNLFNNHRKKHEKIQISSNLKRKQPTWKEKKSM